MCVCVCVCVCVQTKAGIYISVSFGRVTGAAASVGERGRINSPLPV